MKKIVWLLWIASCAFAQNPFDQLQIHCPRAGKSAPHVSEAYIVRIISDRGGYEDIQEDQERTYHQHSPKGLKAITAVCGYGGIQHDVLEYAGSPLQAIREQDIDSNQDGIVDGFLILWDMEGKSLGSTLYYKAFSANAGANKVVKLNVRSSSQ